jgi:inosose dehydratase
VRLGYHLAPWVRDNHHENFHRALDEISLTGWDGLEFSGTWAADRFGRHPGELRALLAMHDLEMASSYFRPSYLRDRREPDLELARRVIAMAAEAGCENLLIDGGYPDPGGAPVSTDDYQRVAEVANLVGALAREAGMTCSWHQHWGTLFERPEPFDELMERTDPDLVRFCPDTAQLMMGDFDVLATFRRYARRIGFVHFKDIDTNRPWSVAAAHGGPSTWADTGGYHVDSKWRFVELGRGQIDFPALLAVLREAGFDGWIVDDFDYSAYPTREASTVLLRYLRDGLGIVGRRGRAGWAG